MEFNVELSKPNQEVHTKFEAISKIGFAPIQSEGFDVGKLAAEVLTHESKMAPIYVYKKNLDENMIKSLPKLGSKEDYEKVDYFDPENGSSVRVRKDDSAFLGINFTSTSSIKNSQQYVFSQREAMAKHTWNWNPELPVPQLSTALERLFQPERLLMCRALVTKNSGIVPWHRDPGGKELRQNGYLQVNLILQSGGSPLLIKIGETITEVWDHAFIFNDGYLHAVPKVKTTRVILSIAAQFNIERLHSLIDWKRAQLAPQRQRSSEVVQGRM
jgi:hypothetical protein